MTANRTRAKGGSMLRWLTTRRLFVFLSVAAAVAAVPLAVLAATGSFGGALDRQRAMWTTSDAMTSSTAWRNVPGLGITRCTLNQVTATLSTTVGGGPVQFRVIIDGVPEAPMKPGVARFVPNGIESFSYTFVGNTGPFEADDTHRFNVQWRSPSGAALTMRRGAVNLLYQRGTQGCP
jgi:hypothetical protein